ncbi:NAD(P)-dependent alcohol dehydrogenase [Martelella mediterranea]|uniref:NAD(P)-dependent alcohol dehydrogenase n=1 Tax=Martelella mediterranea TaxID=293089 RepID=UPI001E2FBA7E|nr:NAD(P)-dependent alcohol dehydrogenase [Martelella mediterranea]MCD1635791.1 NAD(P)-dependent alcohol dehydrogenase [Martelella mediterranea]
MAENKAAVYLGPDSLEISDWPMPVAKPGQVIVEVMACGVCGSDIHVFRHGQIGDLKVKPPLVLGHESSGIIVDAGDGVDRARIGERVAIEPQETCGHCAACRSGHYNLCPEVRYYSAFPVHGAFQRYVAIDNHLAHGVPDSVSFEAAGLIEPVSVVLWAAQKARIMAGDRVLVTGAGPIGNLAVQFADLNGATEVAVVDVVAARLDAAMEMGGTRRIDNSDGALAGLHSDFDVLLECTGAPAVVAEALRHVRPAGRAVLVGMAPEANASLPIALLQAREVEITGTFRFANTYERALRIAASGRLRLDDIVTDRFSLAETAAALRAPQVSTSVIKPMVYPGR